MLRKISNLKLNIKGTRINHVFSIYDTVEVRRNVIKNPSF